MWGRFFGILVLFVCILNLVGVSSRHYPPNNVQGSLQNPHSLHVTPFSDHKGGIVGKEEKYKKVGSKPPRCDNKCYGCMPCEAIQVPTISHVGVLYTNYEPEGWKCKCGTTFYSP